MEFLVAALFVGFIILAIYVFNLWKIVKCYFTIQVDTQEWNRAKLNILTSEFKKERVSNTIALAKLGKKIEDEKIRVEEFIHGVYKDYTFYIENEFKNIGETAVNEVEVLLKKYRKPVKRAKK